MKNIRLSQSKRHWFYVVTLAAILPLLVGCGSTPPLKSTELQSNLPVTRTIVWGKVDSEPTEAIEKWQPVVDYLAANLSNSGIGAGEVKIAKDMETMNRWMATGEVDLVTDSLYPAMIVADNAGAIPLVVRHRGKTDKHAVFFTRADSGLTSLGDLEGQMIALAEPHSTSGFMLPKVHLKESDIKSTEKESDESSVEAEEVGYYFAGDDDVVVQWVLNGRIIAGAVDNETFEDYSEGNPGMLTVLAETPKIARDPLVLVRNDLDPVLRENIKKVLMEMDQTPAGQAILEENGTKRFGNFGAEIQTVWDEAWEKYQFIKD